MSANVSSKARPSRIPKAVRQTTLENHTIISSILTNLCPHHAVIIVSQAAPFDDTLGTLTHVNELAVMETKQNNVENT